MPKMTMPHEIVAAMVRFMTPVNAAMYPDVIRPTKFDEFKMTSW
jgi:hypothetical protein